MNGADDQRLAPTETQRLRNQIDDLTRERDLYKRMLERYEPDPTYSTPTEIDRLRARVAELEAASPDDAHTTETWTEYRVCGIHPQRGREVADYFESLSMAREQVQHCAEDGWTDVVIESRTVSTTTRTTDWKADES